MATKSFVRHFSISNKLKTSTVHFIANRQDPQRQFKVHDWTADPIKAGKLQGSSRYVFDKMQALETPQQIWEFITTQSVETPDIEKAIRYCFKMNDVAMCWKCFEYAKSKFIVSANIYYHMFWVLNNSTFYTNEQKIIQIHHQLMSEIKSLDIEITPFLITSIFSLLTKYQQYSEGHKIWNELKEAQHALLCEVNAWNSYIDLNIKQCLLTPTDNEVHLKHILSLLDAMCNDYKLVTPNDTTYTNIISAIAKLLKRHKKYHKNFKEPKRSDLDFVNIGERVFQQSKEILGRDPLDNVYAVMIDLYGNDGNIEKAMEFLEIVIDKQLEKREIFEKWQNWKFTDTNARYNERTLRSCFGSTIKAIISNEDISCEDGWKLIDYLIEDLLKKKCNLEMDVVAYALLFHCVGAFDEKDIDMKKLKKLYKEMLSKGITPNNLAVNNFFIVAQTKYKNDKKKLDKLAKWTVKEFHKYKIPMPRVLQVRLNKLMIYHDDSIRAMIKWNDSVVVKQSGTGRAVFGRVKE